MCVCMCVCACMRACVHVCMHVHACVHACVNIFYKIKTNKKHWTCDIHSWTPLSSKVFASMVCNLSTYQCDLSTYQCGLSTYQCGLSTYQCGLSKYGVCSNVLSSHGWVANWPTAAMKWGKSKSTTGGTERDSKPFLSISLMFITTPFLSISLPDITILANWV